MIYIREDENRSNNQKNKNNIATYDIKSDVVQIQMNKCEQKRDFIIRKQRDT